MLVMIGVWIAMQNAELLGWGGVAKSVPTPFPTAAPDLGSVSVAPLRLFVFVVSGLTDPRRASSPGQRTKLGRAMRATFQDRETAALMGVSVERIDTVTFAFGSGACRRRRRACWGRSFCSTPRWATSPRSRPSRS